MSELLDIFDINGNFLGVKTREECHCENPGFYHKTVLVWIKNDKNEILIQKRALSKTHNPGKWQSSTSGHVATGENCLHCCVRETREELGIKTKEEDYQLLKEWVKQDGWELMSIYLLKQNIDIKDIKLQTSEVSAVKWVSYDQFKKIFLTSKFCSQSKEYRDWLLEALK